MWKARPIDVYKRQIGQTAKWLGADDVVNAALQKFQHLACQEPALTGLVAQRNIFLCHIGQMADGRRGVKMFAGLQLFSGNPSEVLQQGNSHIAEVSGGTFASQMIGLKVAVVETI